MPGNRRLLLVCSQDLEPDLELPGWELVPCPVNRVVSLPTPWSGSCDAVIVTSRHAVPWLARTMGGFAGPVGVSGPATAAKVRDAGFRAVAPQGWGGEGALKALGLPAGSKVLFPCGERTAGSVEGQAHAKGIELTRLEVYRLEPCAEGLEALPEDVEGVVFLSGQMVRHFHEGLGAARPGGLRLLPALCTPSARTQLQALAWEGPLVELEKKGGHTGLSRLLLKAVLSHQRSKAGDAAEHGGIASGCGGAEMTGPS